MIGFTTLTYRKYFEKNNLTPKSPWKSEDGTSPLKVSNITGWSYLQDWLVVTGTMEFYDFPFSWAWKIIPTD